MKKIKVLVVDDASFMRGVVKKGVLGTFPDFEIKEAEDGKIAQTLLEQENFDIILCDWEMPNMTGDELLTWVRNDSPKKDTVFVLITSRGEKEHVIKALQLKANNYIVKPFTNEKLVDVVTALLTKSLGIKANELKQYGGAGRSAPLSSSDEAINILTQSRPQTAKPKQAVKKVTTTTTAATTDEKPVEKKVAHPKNKTIAQIRWKNLKSNCIIKEITLTSVTAVIRGDANIPTIMELVVFDLVTNNRQDVSRINGYTHQLQARETSAESEFVNITIYFVDGNDADKQAHLKRFIDSINQQ